MQYRFKYIDWQAAGAAAPAGDAPHFQRGIRRHAKGGTGRTSGTGGRPGPEVFRDDASMKGFLNFMAQCTPQSTRNLLILYEQDPTITHPRTFDKWKEAGRSLRSGVTGMRSTPTRSMNGKMAPRATASPSPKPLTSLRPGGQQPLPSQQRLPEEIIAALVEQSPVPLAISVSCPKECRRSMSPSSAPSM